MRARLRHPLRAWGWPALLVVVLAASLAVTATAGARTYFVSGQQVGVDDTTATMRGSLLGTWTYLSGDWDVSRAPLYRVFGQERFDGCLNRNRDFSCRHDPHGSVMFYNDTWLQATGTDPDTDVWVSGACVHPIITGTGTGAFAGAQGVLVMVDTYAPNGTLIFTRYDGNVILPDHQSDPEAPQGGFTGPMVQTAAAPLSRLSVPRRQGCGGA